MKNFYFLFIKENKKIFFKTFFFFWLASLIHGYNTHNPYEENFSFFIFILHTTNLIFHEAGHPLMSIFGTIPGIFGGTLFQIGIPTVCVFYFLLKKEYFSSGVVTLWVSSNFYGAGWYIADAIDRVLPLLGEGSEGDKSGHDWHNLLTHFGKLTEAPSLANTVFWWGSMLFFVSFLLALIPMWYHAFTKFIKK